MLLVVVELLWRRWCRAECGRNAEFVRNYNDVCALDVAVILAALSRGGWGGIDVQFLFDSALDCKSTYMLHCNSISKTFISQNRPQCIKTGMMKSFTSSS